MQANKQSNAMPAVLLFQKDYEGLT